MTRSAFAPAAVLLCCTLAAPMVAAQAKSTPAKAAAQTPAAKAAPTPSEPAAPAKFVRPVKGRATVDYIQGPPKIVTGKEGKEIITSMKVKNTSPGSIALFKIDEYWYDKGKPPKVVTGDQERWLKPFNPGEVIELTMKSPWKPDLYMNQYQFSHANGDIKPQRVGPDWKPLTKK
jgi:hypothetical protein